jgi:uncharacterized membrane protein
MLWWILATILALLMLPFIVIFTIVAIAASVEERSPDDMGDGSYL